MGRVFFSVTVSLDGFMAPESPIDRQWLDQWMRLQDFVLHQHFFRRNLKLGEMGRRGWTIRSSRRRSTGRA